MCFWGKAAKLQEPASLHIALFSKPQEFQHIAAPEAMKTTSDRQALSTFYITPRELVSPHIPTGLFMWIIYPELMYP
jgi:hypothetical protein